MWSTENLRVSAPSDRKIERKGFSHMLKARGHLHLRVLVIWAPHCHPRSGTQGQPRPRGLQSRTRSHGPPRGPNQAAHPGPNPPKKTKNIIKRRAGTTRNREPWPMGRWGRACRPSLRWWLQPGQAMAEPGQAWATGLGHAHARSWPIRSKRWESYVCCCFDLAAGLPMHMHEAHC